MRIVSRVVATGAIIIIKTDGVEQQGHSINTEVVDTKSSASDDERALILGELNRMVNEETFRHWEDLSIERVEKTRDDLLAGISELCKDVQAVEAACAKAKEGVLKKSEVILKSLRAREGPSQNDVTIELIKHASLPDPRPRVRVQFILNGQPTVFSLMFDTGSALNVIVRGQEEVDGICEDGPPCRGEIERPIEVPINGEGYVDDGKQWVICGPRKGAAFGSDECRVEIDELKTIQEVVRLVGDAQTFQYLLYLKLLSGFENEYMGIGVLGAARLSEFAKRARAFTFIGPTTESDGGTLLVGPRDSGALYDEYCEKRNGDDLLFLPNIEEVYIAHWIVEGSMGFGVSGFSEPVHWLADTGAGYFYVPVRLYNEVVRDLTMKGASVAPRYGNNRALVRNCPREASPVSFNIGTGSDQISVQFADYLINYDSETGDCELDLDPSELTFSPGTRILGMGILSKLVTVFDYDNSRVGFCVQKK